jgi:hypothetical protein
VGHTLFYFTQEGKLIFDPMAGGGVVPDICLAFNRRCWSFDVADRPETRPEIEPQQWNPERLVREHAKTHARIAFLNSDWPPARKAYALEGESFKEYQQEKKIRNRVSFFQTTLTSSRPPGGSSPISWIVPCLSEPEATQRFLPNMVSRMHKNRTLGVVRRSLIIGIRK